jgi:menaquinone-9 beta-reductase
LDKSRFPRAKLCGEFLGPDALAALQRLNLLERVQEEAFGPVEHTFFFNRKGQRIKIQHAWISRKYPYGLAIPREILDHILITQARNSGIQVLEGHRILSPIQVDHDKFKINTEAKFENGQHQPESWITPCFIDATGRSGKLALQATSNQSDKNSRQKQKWIGIQCHVNLPEQPLGGALSMFLFDGGYGGIQPIAANQANICMMVEASLGKNMHANFQEFIVNTMGRNPAAQEILQHAQLDGTFCTTADINLANHRKNPTKHSTHRNLIRIGDASVTIDPFTGSGMAHALETGWLAAEILHQGSLQKLPYQTLHKMYQQQYQRQFRTRLRLMQWFRPLLESEQAQHCLWPFLPPLLPMLAATFR